MYEWLIASVLGGLALIVLVDGWRHCRSGKGRVDPYEKHHPHTHTPKLQRGSIYSSGKWRVLYGDTGVTIDLAGEGNPTAEQVSEAVRQAVEKHDAGTIAALEQAKQLDEAKAALTILGKERKGVWGSELLKK